MKQPSEKLRKKIKLKRPDITDSSLHTYITSLRMLYSQYVDGDESKLEKPLKTKFLHNFESIKKLLELCRTPNTCKNRLTSILVALDAETKNRDQKLIDKYQAYLKDIMVGVNKQIESQELTRKESTNWLDFNDVKDVTNKILEKINKNDLWKKSKLSKSEYGLVQKYVLLRFYLSYPMRNNVADTKVVSPAEYKGLDDDERKGGNYLIRDGKKYIFKLNKFKNVKRIGVKSYDINPEISKLLTKWFRINNSGFMFTLNDGRTALSANGVTKVMNSIFSEFADGKKISTSMLRHIQISDDLKDEPTLAEKKAKAEKTEQKYQHSSSMNQTYRRIDTKD
tara:strand:+ start:189 stop:1202 length:1014 start_codon:yes stop_codon:yes gene_type:complete